MGIYLDFYCLDKMEVNSSESRDSMCISGKWLTTYMTLRTKSPNNKQKAGTAVNDIANQSFRNLLKDFNNSPYLGYKKKQVSNERT